jgi:hypothetical protein
VESLARLAEVLGLRDLTRNLSPFTNGKTLKPTIREAVK